MEYSICDTFSLHCGNVTCQCEHPVLSEPSCDTLSQPTKTLQLLPYFLFPLGKSHLTKSHVSGRHADMLWMLFSCRNWSRHPEFVVLTQRCPHDSTWLFFFSLGDAMVHSDCQKGAKPFLQPTLWYYTLVTVTSPPYGPKPGVMIQSKHCLLNLLCPGISSQQQEKELT